MARVRDEEFKSLRSTAHRTPSTLRSKSPSSETNASLDRCLPVAPGPFDKPPDEAAASQARLRQILRHKAARPRPNRKGCCGAKRERQGGIRLPASGLASHALATSLNKW
jgi:hypothetical protein